MKASVVADWTQVVANSLTALGIILAAIATARLRPLAGRPDIGIEHRVLRKRTNDEGVEIGTSVLIIVTIKNAGRVRLKKNKAWSTLTPLAAPDPEQDPHKKVCPLLPLLMSPRQARHLRSPISFSKAWNFWSLARKWQTPLQQT